MKIVISERQYNLILGKMKNPQEMGEQETQSSGPSAGTSSSGSKEGYPQVGKWSDSITISRGPANQLGVTKWEDIVGSTLKRGPANKLK